MHFNIGVSAGFHHAWRNHTHGAVTGGKRFVQSGHRSADRRFVIDHVNQQTTIGKVEGRLHASNT
jgi:hypothetical protein